MPRVLVLGTGTGVGKTWVACALARAFLRAGKSVRGLKPIESGYTPAASDAARLGDAAGHAPASPLYALAQPLSPHLAARRASLEIQLSHVKPWIDANSDTLQYTIVESAGGALSPLADNVTNAELALALAPTRVLLVAPDRLGVLHDVTATTLALRTRGVTVDELVLSRIPPGDPSTGTNAGELERLGIARVRAVVGDDADVDRLARALL